MPATAPDWAKDRPTESDPRFRLDTPVAASAKDSATSTEPAKSGDAKP
jgi:hypothetical protein